MDEQDNNPTNTQGADEQMPANDTNSGMNNMSEDRQDMPAPNNGEGGESNVDNLPTGGEEDDDMDDQRTGVNFDDQQ